MINEQNSLSVKRILSVGWKKIVVVVILFMLIMIPLDAKHQLQIAEVDIAYQMFQDGDFDGALEKFKQYKNSHGEIYWKLQEIVTRDNNPYRLDIVSKMIDKCDDKM